MADLTPTQWGYVFRPLVAIVFIAAARVFSRPLERWIAAKMKEGRLKRLLLLRWK